MQYTAIFGLWRAESEGPVASAELIHLGDQAPMLIESQSHHACLL